MSRVYVRPRGGVRATPGQPLSVGDLAEVRADDDALSERVRSAPVARAPQAGRFAVVSVLDLLRRAEEAAGAADVRLLGAEDVVVEAAPPPTPLRTALAALAWVLLLLGAATAILNFHADVNMPAAHREIYRLLTGREADRPPVMEVPYAVGVGAGILLFFHRPWHGGRGGEPSPLEVEMDVYDRKLQAYCRDRARGPVRRPPRSAGGAR